VPAGSSQACFHPSIWTARNSLPPARACQPTLKFSFTTR
jgi:hypothetical protein